MRKLSIIEQRVLQRMKNHLHRFGGKRTERDGSGIGMGETGAWHCGWRCGFRAAIQMVAFGSAGATKRELAARRKAVKRYLDRVKAACREPRP